MHCLKGSHAQDFNRGGTLSKNCPKQLNAPLDLHSGAYRSDIEAKYTLTNCIKPQNARKKTLIKQLKTNFRFVHIYNVVKHNFFILYVQEVLTHIYSNLLYEIGPGFLDIQYKNVKSEVCWLRYNFFNIPFCCHCHAAPREENARNFA